MIYISAYGYGVGAVLGVLSHVLYFRRGEHHKETLPYLQLFAASIPISTLALAHFLHLAYGQAILCAICTVGSFLGGVWTSMIIYRAFFHPLNKFPGPWPLKISKFSQVVSGWKLDAFRKSYRQHQKYGNFVRTGRSTISERCACMHGFQPMIARHLIFVFRTSVSTANVGFLSCTCHCGRFFVGMMPL